MIGIVEWAGSKYGFYVDRHFAGGRWILEPGPIRLADYHASILQHCFTPDEHGRLPYDTILWCEPAKSGKSAIAGLCAKYTALHGEQNSQILMASNKRNQAASLMFKSLTDSIEYNPHLPNIEPGRYTVEFRNGNTVTAIPSNSKGEAGARYSLAVFDELWGYVYQDAVRLWAEFKTDPTRQNSVRLAVGYAGYLGESDLWHSLLTGAMAGDPVPDLAHITNDDGQPCCVANGRTFAFWSHVCRQPWQTDEWITEQRRTLRPAEFARMIQTTFVEGVGDFIPQDDWLALIDLTHRPLEPGSQVPVYIGLDIATKTGGDDCALIGVYNDQGRVKVAFHKVWQGGKARKKDLRLSRDVQPYLEQLARDYIIAGLHFDPYQSLQLAENLQRAGLTCVEVTQSHVSRGPLDTALYEMAVSGQLVIYDHPELKKMAQSAHAKELGNGLLFIKKAGRGKIDLLVALSNCANAARQSAWGDRFIKYRSESPGLLIAGARPKTPESNKMPGRRYVDKYAERNRGPRLLG